MMAYVASGRLAGFFEHELCAWDLAAGSLLVQEAGGCVASTRGEPYALTVRDVMATNGVPAIHDGALALLARCNAASVDPPEA